MEIRPSAPARGPARGLGAAVLGSVVTLAGLGAAIAAEPAAQAYGLDVTDHVEVRMVSGFALDAEATPRAQATAADHRLRLSPSFRSERVDLHLQADLFAGQIFGDPEPTGAAYAPPRDGDPTEPTRGWGRFEARQAWVEVRTAIGHLRLGQQPSAWGLGLLATDGEDPADAPRPWAGDFRGLHRFGGATGGDLSERVLIATRPLGLLAGPRGGVADTLSRLTLVAAGDLVFRDDQADLTEGDRAWQGVGALFYPGDRLFAGAYVAHRRQRDDAGSHLNVTAMDAYARLRLPLEGWRAELRLQAEGLGVVGTTDRLRTEAARGGVDVAQLGGALLTELALPAWDLATGFELGLASGDADPDDGEARALTFDPNHRIGLILFSEVVRRLTLRGAERAADPGRLGVPPPGVAALPTAGGVRDALYVDPGLTWRPGAATFALGALAAWAPAGLVDPFETFAAGGRPTSPGARAAHAFAPYGLEFDGHVGYGFAPAWLRAAELGVDGGVLLPGAALAGLCDAVFEVRTSLDVRF